VGQSNGPPRLLDAAGAPLILPWNGNRAEAPATALVILPAADRPLVFRLSNVPAGATWVFARGEEGVQATLRLPPSPCSSRHAFTLHVWQPYRDEAAVLQGLVKSQGN